MQLANSAQGLAVSRWGERVEFYVDIAKRRVTVRFGRKLTAADIRSYADHLRTNPAFDPKFSEIVDLREVEDLDLKAQDFLKLADEIDPFSPVARRAFVIRTSVQTHAARMHKILRAEKNMGIFSSMEQAEEWIEWRPAARD